MTEVSEMKLTKFIKSLQKAASVRLLQDLRAFRVMIFISAA